MREREREKRTPTVSFIAFYESEIKRAYNKKMDTAIVVADAIKRARRILGLCEPTMCCNIFVSI